MLPFKCVNSRFGAGLIPSKTFSEVSFFVYVRHDSVIRETWLIHIWDMNLWEERPYWCTTVQLTDALLHWRTTVQLTDMRHTCEKRDIHVRKETYTRERRHTCDKPDPHTMKETGIWEKSTTKDTYSSPAVARSHTPKQTYMREKLLIREKRDLQKRRNRGEQ